MEVLDALRSRRSVRRFTKQPIPQSLLQEILSVAPWVPNHHVSQPWRFIVITGDSLTLLADLRAQAVLKKRQGQATAQERSDKAREEFKTVGAVIAVVQKVDAEPTRREEDYAAMAMATYNIMLAAWDRGIGSYWNTGPLVQDSAVHDWLGLNSDERPIAFLRMGYPDTIPVTRRTPIEERLEWRT